LLRYVVGAVCLLLLMAMVLGILNESPTTPSRSAPLSSTAQPDSNPASPQLALLSRRGYRSEGGDFMIVEGQVKNISNRSMKNVEAVASWYSKDGSFISSDDALIKYDPILPGQTSPFQVMTRAIPRCIGFQLSSRLSPAVRSTQLTSEGNKTLHLAAKTCKSEAERVA
jgi:hypothetical protein